MKRREFFKKATAGLAGIVVVGLTKSEVKATPITPKEEYLKNTDFVECKPTQEAVDKLRDILENNGGDHQIEWGYDPKGKPLPKEHESLSQERMAFGKDQQVEINIVARITQERYLSKNTNKEDTLYGPNPNIVLYDHTGQPCGNILYTSISYSYGGGNIEVKGYLQQGSLPITREVWETPKKWKLIFNDTEYTLEVNSYSVNMDYGHEGIYERGKLELYPPEALARAEISIC